MRRGWSGWALVALLGLGCSSSKDGTDSSGSDATTDGGSGDDGGSGSGDDTSGDDGGSGDDGSGDSGGDSGGDDGSIDWDSLNGDVPAAPVDVPEFAARNYDGGARSREDVLGHPTVMWFYPAAATSG